MPLLTFGDGGYDWEGYRVLRVTATLAPTSGGRTSATLSLGVGGKSYRVAVDSSPTPFEVDLLAPSNLPAGFRLDSRQGRYPLKAQEQGYVPTVAPIVEDADGIHLDDEGKGWLFGALEDFRTVSIGGLLPGESVTISGMDLVVEAGQAPRARLLAPFAPDAELLGWQSPTDSTYLWPLLYLHADELGSHRVGPWPYAAHVSPTDGSADSVSYWSLDDLAGFVASCSGWAARTFASPYPSAVPVGPAAPAWQAFSLLREADGTWLDQTLLESSAAAPADVWAADSCDVVASYPGCGDPGMPYGASNRKTPLATGKVLRGEAEGATFTPAGMPNAGATVSYGTETSPALYGTGTSGGRGGYRTGSPYAKGGLAHVRAKSGGDYSEGRSSNRLPWRASFLVVPARGFVHISPEWFTGSMLTLSAGSDGTVQAKVETRPDGQSWTGTVGMGDSAQGQHNPTSDHGAFWGAAKSDGTQTTFARSYDLGQTWTDDSMAIPGILPAHEVESNTGVSYIATYDDPSTTWTLYRMMPGDDGHSIPTDASGTAGGVIATDGTKAQAGLANDYVQDGALVFAYDNGTEIKKRFSRDLGFSWTDS